jgi:polysaccharide biosynthesis protein PslG
MKRLGLTLLLVGCLCAGTSASASAKGLFGVTITPDLAAEPVSVLDAQMALMHHSGVQWVRVNFDWSRTELAQGQYDWSELDNLAGAAARHGISLLPLVEFTPQWASSHPSAAWTEYAPTSPSLFASFMTALVERYGPHGKYWTAHRPARPIRAWQIWNEPEGVGYDWRSQPWSQTYPPLLKAAYAAVHRADRGASVVSGALVALACKNCLPWQEASLFYRAGFKRYFDVLAINDFTRGRTPQVTVNDDLTIVNKVRAVMARYHDLRKPIWITELTWTAALGKIPPSSYLGFETTAKGQAARMTALYTRLATRHPANVQKAFWYAWSSSYSPQPEFTGSDLSFQYVGLLKWAPSDPVFQPMPLLQTYAKLAHRYG